jgi:hypothetical protein
MSMARFFNTDLLEKESIMAKITFIGAGSTVFARRGE